MVHWVQYTGLCGVLDGKCWFFSLCSYLQIMRNIYCIICFSWLLCELLAGLPAWNAVTDDAKLLLGDEAKYTELVQKYGEKAVQNRQKFLSEAEYGSSAPNVRS